MAPEERMGKFFLANVEDEKLLHAFRELLHSAMDRGISDAEFADEAWSMLENLRLQCDMPTVEFMPRGLDRKGTRDYQRDVTRIDSLARLQLVFRTQCDMAAGWREFFQAFDPVRLQRFPGWRFVRQPGARIKRRDHVEHEGEVRLKTDYEFWMARNSPDQGGFNQPGPPFGYNSWMVVAEVSREECEALGLLAPGEVVQVPAVYARWGVQVENGRSEGSGGAQAWLLDAARASVRELPESARRGIVERCAQEGIAVQEVDGEMFVDRELSALLREVDDLLRGDELLGALEDEVEGAHCNQFGHVPGCNNGPKMEALPEQSGVKPLRVSASDKLSFFAAWMRSHGVHVQTPLGDDVSMDEQTFMHILENNASERSWRLRNLPLVVETLKNPAEVWQGFKGNKVHIARFRVGDKPRVVVAVTHGRRVVTFYAEKNYPEWMDRYRRGKLLYKRKETAA